MPTRKLAYKAVKGALHGVLAFGLLVAPYAPVATAAEIIFQNDIEFEMDADNLVIDFDDTTRTTGDVYIDFGNSSSADNGRITWSFDDNRFEFTQDVYFLAGSEFDAAAADNFSIREHGSDLNDATGLFCTQLNSLAFRTDTGEMYYCDTIGSADTIVQTFDTTNTSTTVTAGDTTGLVIGQAVSGAGIPVGATVASITNATTFELSLAATATASGVSLTFEDAHWTLIGADSTNATASSFVTFASDPATCTPGDVYYNTTDNQAYTCTATDTWTVMGPQDFEDVFAYDGDNTLTTSNADFTINTGTGDLIITSSNWSVNADGDATFVDLTATGDVNFSGANSVRIEETTDYSTEDCVTEGELIYDTVLNTMYVCTVAGTPGTWIPIGGANDANVEDMTFHPEFPNVVYVKDGTSNKGTLLADFDATRNTQYYEWTTKQNSVQDVDVNFRFPLPADYTATDAVTIEVYTATATAADNDILITINEISGTSTTQCYSALASTEVTLAVTTWNTVSLAAGDLSGCTLAAGDIIEMSFKMQVDNTNNGVIRVGEVVFDYTQ